MSLPGGGSESVSGTQSRKASERRCFSDQVTIIGKERAGTGQSGGTREQASCFGARSGVV